jgi:aminoglycoside phosphotransferase (APT) family kinase protein
VPLGLFGQNVFLTSTRGAFVLRGAPHFPWQFPTEQFYAQQLHEHTRVPAPWPYLIEQAQDIFGWSYAIMPRLPGSQMSLMEAQRKLTREDQYEIAVALGENLALMHELSWPFPGRYNADTQSVQPFELLRELAFHCEPLRRSSRAPISDGSLWRARGRAHSP